MATGWNYTNAVRVLHRRTPPQKLAIDTNYSRSKCLIEKQKTINRATYSGHSKSHFVLGAGFTRMPRRRTGGQERRRVAKQSKASQFKSTLPAQWFAAPYQARCWLGERSRFKCVPLSTGILVSRLCVTSVSLNTNY